jgi:hypothetical protein
MELEQLRADENDRPHYHYNTGRRSYAALVTILLLALLASAGYSWYYFTSGLPMLPDGPALPPAEQPAEPAAAAAPAAPPPAEPRTLQAQPEAAASLPTLDNSDALLRRSIAGLMGDDAFAKIVIPEALVRRIVATVDNLPRETAPRRVWPLNSVPGAFAVSGSGGGELTIDPQNAVRYAPYVRVMDAIDTRALVKAYVATYPLFQKAYEQLGFPGLNFNHRLLEAIDDMLATPELDGPVALLQPRVVYQFLDPDLETRSAGQKILLRMGRENAVVVKAKLRELRRELLAAAERSRQSATPPTARNP